MSGHDYVPMTGPLPGERWMPSNGTDGMCFIDAWCSNCARDREMNGTTPSDQCDENDWCPILGASYRDEAVEWREMPDGECKCLGFVPMEQPVPPPRCEHTADLFAGSPSGT